MERHYQSASEVPPERPLEPKIDYARIIKQKSMGRQCAIGDAEYEGKKCRCIIMNITESRGDPVYSIKIFTETHAEILIYIFIHQILPITSTITSEQAKEILAIALDTFEYKY